MGRARAWGIGALAALCPVMATAGQITADPDPQGIYGGAPVDACAWPAATYSGGCTASLVHPRMIVLAAHCVAYGNPTEVSFGENFRAPARTIELAGCLAHPQWVADQPPGPGKNDIGICELAEPVEDVPIVPILMGCEAEMLQPGASAWLVGFGESDDALGFGPKRAVATEIQGVDDDVILVGDGVHSACFGDSGGPAYLQLPDGSWRVFGATSGASMNTPDCPQTGYWTLIHPYVPWIEETSGIDITPCHDADGTWNPSESCTSFPLTPGLGGGDWALGCAGEVSELGASCGPAFDGGDDTGASTGVETESSSSGAGGDDDSTSGSPGDFGTSSDSAAGTTGDTFDGDESGSVTAMPFMEDDDDADGCGCTSGSRPDVTALAALSLLALLLAPRRKQ